MSYTTLWDMIVFCRSCLQGMHVKSGAVGSRETNAGFVLQFLRQTMACPKARQAMREQPTPNDLPFSEGPRQRPQSLQASELLACTPHNL